MDSKFYSQDFFQDSSDIFQTSSICSGDRCSSQAYSKLIQLLSPKDTHYKPSVFFNSQEYDPFGLKDEDDIDFGDALNDMSASSTYKCWFTDSQGSHEASEDIFSKAFSNSQYQINQTSEDGLLNSPGSLSTTSSNGSSEYLEINFDCENDTKVTPKSKIIKSHPNPCISSSEHLSVRTSQVEKKPRNINRPPVPKFHETKNQVSKSPETKAQNGISFDPFEEFMKLTMFSTSQTSNSNTQSNRGSVQSKKHLPSETKSSRNKKDRRVHFNLDDDEDLESTQRKKVCTLVKKAATPLKSCLKKNMIYQGHDNSE